MIVSRWTGSDKHAPNPTDTIVCESPMVTGHAKSSDSHELPEGWVLLGALPSSEGPALLLRTADGVALAPPAADGAVWSPRVLPALDAPLNLQFELR